MSNEVRVGSILEDRVEAITKDYTGSIHDLYSAVGVLAIGQLVGWRVLRITLGMSTYAKYQRILGVDFKVEFPERGNYAKKSLALDMVDGLKNFWDVVKGKDKIDPIVKRTLV